MQATGAKTSSRGPAVLAAAALLAAGGITALTPAAPAQADGPARFHDTTPIALPDPEGTDRAGPMAPYPSSIEVFGMSGPVQEVSVDMLGLTHTFVNDFDVLLVAPTGESLVLMSDVGESTWSLSATDGADVTLADVGASFPTSGVLPSGTYAPTNYDAGPDSFPEPAPAPGASGTFAQAFSGIDPNGDWDLYVVDDNTGDAGSIDGGWRLTITTAETAAATSTTFSIDPNPAFTSDRVTLIVEVTSGGEPVTEGTVTFRVPGTAYPEYELDDQGRVVAGFRAIALEDLTQTWTATYTGTDSFVTSSATAHLVINDRTVVSGNMYCNPGWSSIPDVGTARGYPLQVFVDDRPGTPVTDATVHLQGLQHDYPGDLDLMLVSPDGDSLMLLSDVSGGLAEPSDVVIADDGSPTTSLTGPGTYLPTNLDDGGNDAFPEPAPEPSDAETFADSVVGGTANGTWSLYIVDDASGDAGALTDGWCLELTSEIATEVTLDAPASVTTGGDAQITATVTGGGGSVDAGTVSYSVDGGTAIDAGTPDANGEVTFTIEDLERGVHSIAASYTGADGFGDSQSGTAQITAISPTSTTITADPATQVAHQPVELSVAVTADGEAVTEGAVTVAFGEQTVEIDATDLSTETVTITPTSADPIEVTASYSGPEYFAVSDDELTLTPQLATTALALDAPGTATTGDDVELTATVTSGGGPLEGGTVSYSVDGGTPVEASTPDANGAVTFTIENIERGVHNVTASYAGAGGYADSQSTAAEITAVSPTATTITTDPATPVAHQPVDISVAVTGDGDAVTEGTVEVTIGGEVTTIDAADLAEETVTITPTSTDPIEIVATYSGAETFTPSDEEVTLTPQLATTEIALDAPSSISTGEDVQVTATVTSSDDPIDVGAVSYSLDGGTPVDAGTPDANGEVTFTIENIERGVYSLTASYTGAGGYADSDAAAVQVTAVSTTTTSILVEGDALEVNEPLEISVTVTGDEAPVTEGTVELVIDDDVTTVEAAELADESVTITPTSTDPIEIVATYSGAETFSPSEDRMSLTPGLADTTLSLDAPGAAVEGETVELRAEVSAGDTGGIPTGTVTFSDGEEELGTVSVTGGVAELSTALPAGVRTVTAVFASTDGYATSQDEAEVDVTPVAAAGGPYQVAEGEALTLSADGSSPAATIGWDVDGDGDFTDATGAEATLTWAELEALGIDDGPADHEIAVQAEADGLTALASAPLEVTNTGPEVIIDGPSTAVAGEELTLKLSADDPSSADMAALFTYYVDWGDGSPVDEVVGPADPPVTHTYTEAGEVEATFFVADRDGASAGEVTLTITVEPAEEVPDETPTDPGDETPGTGDEPSEPEPSEPESSDDGADGSTDAADDTRDAGDSADASMPGTGVSGLGLGAAAAVLLLALGALLAVVRRRLVD